MVVFSFGGKNYPPIDFIRLPPKSIASEMAARFASGRVAYVPLDNSFNFQESAVDSVIFTIAGLFDNYPAQGVCYDDMCAMRRVCESLGFNFDALILPRFYTLGNREACVYKIDADQERGTIEFEDGRVVIDYTGNGRLCGAFAYTVRSGRVFVHADVHCYVIIDALKNGDLALTAKAYTVGKYAIFANQTPERLCSPPDGLSYKKPLLVSSK